MIKIIPSIFLKTVLNTIQTIPTKFGPNFFLLNNFRFNFIQIVQKDLMFMKYPSLEHYDQESFIKQIKSQGFDDKDILWVASEKVHGSNFSIHYNGDYVKYGRRNDFITKKIPVPCNELKNYFNESFFDAHKLVAKFHNRIKDLYSIIKQIEPNLIKFTIYGQYFGGYWPRNHPDFVYNQLKTIQKNIFYTPNHEYLVFDILIAARDKVYWVDVMNIPKLLKDTFRSVPVYIKGTFDQVIDVNTKINSTIPQLLGLPKLQENFIEGMVIRPNKSLSTEKGSRVALKKKNRQFLEKVFQSTPYEKDQYEKEDLDPALAAMLNELAKYLNVNRISSVVSKYPDLKDRNKLRELIINDIWADAQKDNIKLPLTNEIKYIKLISEFNPRIFKELSNYFSKP